MNIRVHYPDTEEGMKELADRVAKVHAQSVINYINSLEISYEAKVELLDSAMKKKYS